MEKKYIKPEITIVEFLHEDAIMVSSVPLAPKTIVGDVEAASYGTQDFEIFNAE